MLSPLPKTIEELGYKSADPLERATFLEEQTAETPTTLSNANVVEKTIPDLKDRLRKVSEAPISIEPADESQVFLNNLAAFNKSIGRSSSDATGVTKLPGGALDTSGVDFAALKVGEGEPTAPDYYQEQQGLLDQMKATLDTQTKRQIASIEQTYATRRQQQAEIDRRLKEGIEQTLLVGGSSRYAQISAAGVSYAKENESLMNIAALDAEEKSLINEALTAQESGDYELLGKKLELAEVRRKEKQAEATNLATIVAAENQKLRDRQIQVTRDSAVAGLLAQGISDKADVLNLLNYDEEGNLIGDFTAKEIDEALKNLTDDKRTTGESYSVDFKDFNYLNSLPNRGGLPGNIQNPVQYIRYRKELESEIEASSDASGATTSPRGTPEQGSITSLDDIDKLDVSDTTKAVMAGFIGMKDLTPTNKSEVAADLYRVGFNPKQYISRKLEGLVALYVAMPEDQRGLVEGFIKPWASYTIPEVGTFESAKSVLTRELARLNDVGVLSDQDVATYTSAMPSRMDKDVVQVIAKLSGLGLAAGGAITPNAGQTGVLEDGREFVVGVDGETLLDPNTGEPLE